MPTPPTCFPLTFASAPNSLLSLHTHPFALRVVTAENQNIASLLKKPAADAKTSPHMPMRPVTPEEKKHDLFDMAYDKAEALLLRTKRKDTEVSTRSKILAVLKRKLINQLKVPTSANPQFHLYREIDLLHPQAAKSIFWDFKRHGPTRKGKNIYLNWECDDNQTIGNWFRLEEMRENGIRQAMMRNKGQVLVMVRPPMLVEHQDNPEAEGIKMTAGLMTLNCRGIPRFAPPPPAETDTPEDQTEREAAAARDEECAWALVKEYAMRGEHMDRHWYRALDQKYPGEEFLHFIQEWSDEEEEEEEAAASGEEEEV